MRRLIATAAFVIVAATGVGYDVHTYDTRKAAQATVRDYNDGFVDGVCAGSVKVATQAYRFVCKGR